MSQAEGSDSSLPATSHASYRWTGDVSDTIQNMMLQHAKIDNFIKHYLPRRLTADIRAIVSGSEPQRDLMRAACRMTRWIDSNRPQELTLEQPLSVNQDPFIRRIIAQPENWMRRFQGTATKQLGHRIFSCEIFNAREKSVLLKQFKASGTWRTAS